MPEIRFRAAVRGVIAHKARAFRGVTGLATLLLAAFAVSASAQTFGGSNSITVSSTYGVSKNSTVTVSGLSGTVTAISVTFNNANITNLNSVSIALQPPSGTAFDLFGGPCDSGNATFTLSDTGPFGPGNLSGMPPALGISNCPSALSGTYLPADYYANFQTPVFNAGGSGGPSTFNSAGIGNSECVSLGITCGSFNFATAFGLPANGSSFNGTWTLYIASQNTSGSSFNPSGTLGSWTITFTTESAAATTTSISASPNGSTSLVYTSSDVHGDATTPTTVTLTATVTSSGSPVTAGTVTFYDSTGTSAGMGTVLASGVAVNGSGQAATTVTFPGTKEGSRSISAVYNGTSSFAASTSTTPATVLTTNHPYNPSTGTFCNGPLTLNNTGSGTPYPSLLALGTGNSQLTGTIENVTVTLNNISLQNEAELANLGFLLQAPGSNTSGTASSGNAFQFLSWAGNPFSSGSLTFSDEGTSEIPYNMAPACSTCLPTDNWIDIGSDNPDTFPSPAPATFSTAAPTGSATFTTEFGGQGANYTWSLYPDTRIVEPGTAGTIGSWCMNFTMQANAHPTTTSVSGTPNPASTPASTKASVALTANVSVTDTSGLTVNGGTVTFVDGTTNLGSGTVTNGVATLNTTLAEGTHQIVATYSGTNTGTEFGISTGKYNQRVDTATTLPTSGTGAGPYTYCNTGGITVPGLGADAGAASPYPSNIFVKNLPGTVDAVTVQLTGFSTKDQGDLLSLLVGPGGNNLDFFSLTGSNVSNAPSPFNLTFSDTASSLVTGNLSSAGTFKPTSFNTNITYPQCPPNATSCASPPVGPPLPSNPFTPTNKAATAGTAILGNMNAAGVFGGTTSSTYNGNGTWSLYLNDGGPTGGGEASFLTGGWCVSLTENLPTVTVSKSHSGDFTQGQQGAFTVSIKNNGPGPTGDPTGSNPMTVTDTLNSAFSYASSSGTGWTCSASGQTVTCKSDSAVSQGSSYPGLTIDVNVSATASTSITNQVSVIGAGVTSPTNSNTDTVTVIQVPASVTISGGNNQSATIGNAFTTPLSVTVKDANSVLIPSYNVTFTANPGSNGQSGTFSNSTGTITVPTGTGANDGIASAGTFTANSKAGPYSVTATAGSISANFNLTNLPGLPASIALTSGSGQSATIRTAFTNPLIATVTDSGGNLLSGVTVTFTAPTGLTPSVTFSNSSTTISATTNTVGQATSGTMTANGLQGGPYNVQASSGSALNNFQLTNLGKSTTTFASLTTTAATVDVFGFGFTAPSGQLVLTDVNTSTQVAPTVTLNTSTAMTALTTQATTSTGANTLPVWTELADVNGDGILDLITSLYNTDSVTVQLGNGDGTFKAATTYLIASGFGPAEVHAVKLGSGSSSSTVDLIVGSFNVNQIAVLVGNGNGTFGSPTFYSIGTSTNTPTSLTAGDFNHDGKLDVATANTYNNTVSILLGSANGTLTLQSPAINVGHFPEAVRAGDFNGDGYSDLAVANYSDGTVTTLLNNKTGGFTATTKPVGSGAGSGPQALAINGSGSSLLLAVANYHDNTVSVMKSNGSGGFGAQTIVPVGKGPDDVTFADFDGNGIPDLAVSNYTDGTVNLALGSSGGTYTVLGPFKVGSGPYSAAVGDLNLDGTPDVVVSNCFSNNTGVLFDGTQIAVPYSGLTLTPNHTINAAYTPVSSSYGSSNSNMTVP
jgi:Bacterial Ig-like domain (group 3)/FG-GAP-like repeat/FG-GAP repeat